MFQSARVKLTVWYLIIIMFISGMFSVAAYHSASREIERLTNRMLIRVSGLGDPVPFRPAPAFIANQASLEDLQNFKSQILANLLFINFCILGLAGVASYFLAGRTLNPIKLMIDEQNQFISNASHELRTPIATLRAEMEGSLLEKNITDSQARKLISSNLEELSDLQALSSNLLRIAQVHSLESHKNNTKLLVSDLLDAAVKKVQPLAKRKQIVIKKSMSELFVAGDADSLKEVFVILLDNAIKYSAQKTTISISVINNGKTMKVSIKDQGQGISNSDLPYIFDRFFRADKSRSKEGGYGLGLAIAKKIVSNHKGNISVVSKVNSGSTFVVELPMA